MKDERRKITGITGGGNAERAGRAGDMKQELKQLCQTLGDRIRKINPLILNSGEQAKDKFKGIADKHAKISSQPPSKTTMNEARSLAKEIDEFEKKHGVNPNAAARVERPQDVASAKFNQISRNQHKVDDIA